jgi:hypothetical protein
MTLAAVGCGAASGGGAGSGGNDPDVIRAVIGASGGELVGLEGTPLEGVHLTIPPNALTGDTELAVMRVAASQPLPDAAGVGVGPRFALEPAGLPLAAPAMLVLPVDTKEVTDQNRLPSDVNVWAAAGGDWTPRPQTESADGTVTVTVDTLSVVAPSVKPPAEEDVVRFELHPNPQFAPCFSEKPNSPKKAPSVQVTVVRGDLNDELFLRGKNFKPHLQFDLFTVQNSSLDAKGKPVLGFKNFGLAWYQTDLESDDKGVMSVSIRTILLDQIFGFDPAVNLPPTNTFHVGFWFNDPKDAAACGFDVTKPTPFNGEHKAGPLAMISVPNAVTGLGPLCTKPDTSVTPARCNP